ncbi:4-(cytidine 5'-diphospho)-2-C-methyl-D-erythritol kinase [Psychrobacter sp. TAE2020]|uniref:4-(cytidine 5'-diphospho)-2-C-methyl-D-erythritol kinase n=1 Tax=Psychrobacter sp. TAE2020 TaxID=2846762 RepID=UPI001E35D30E|nr:4-(cytidine 5'-diphospho)-2-C-methyl-D-erythritol kinase [Psychrobacter sp. TAE2020]
MISDHNISNSSITRLSPAKINLFLHITGKRADGYHNLQTVFRLLDWGDYLHFLLTDKVVNIDGSLDINKLCSQLLVLTGADAITTSIEDNLIFKAARALVASAIQSNKLPKQLPQVQVTLDKRLPMGAGLGGGSSNAATTLLALNEIWQLNFDKNERIKIGATIGADVPIFIFGQDAIATGIGEQLTAIDLPDQHYLLLTPDAHIDTAKLFAHAKLQRDMASISVATIKHQFTAYTQNLIAPYQNVFTPVVTNLAPEVDEALKYLQRLQKVALGTARMTGSGSAVFLPLDASVGSDEKLLAKWLEEAPCTGYIVGSL